MTSSIYAIEDVIHRNETIFSITLDAAGANYENPVVTIDPPTLGTTATATALSQGPVNSITVTNEGFEYSSTPDVTINGTGTLATATAILGGGVDSVNLINSGSGYTVNFALIFTGGGGSGAEGEAIVDVKNGIVQFINFNKPGDGYSSAPLIDFSNGSGTGATGVSTIGFDKVVDITLDTSGSGYDSDTIFVTISGGGGTEATAKARVQGPVQSTITVTNGGSGYTSAPSVTITDFTGPGTGATATAVIDAINAASDILVNDIVITNDMVFPGGGGILRVYFAIDFATSPSKINVFNNDVFKGTLNADNNSDIVDNGYYRFDIDVEAGDELNFESSENITNVNFFRTHLVQFGA